MAEVQLSPTGEMLAQSYLPVSIILDISPEDCTMPSCHDLRRAGNSASDEAMKRKIR